MPFVIDRRLLILASVVLAVHLTTLWVHIQKNMQQPAAHTSATPTKVMVKPMTKEEWSKHLKERQQIVQNDDTGRKEKPKDEAFLGEKDMAYDRQTVARKVDLFRKAAKGNSSALSANSAPIEKARKKALQDLKLSDLGIGSEALPNPQKRAPAESARMGTESGDVREHGVSSTNDYVEHVALGDFTHLNTVEYKYYGFFHRIRQKLEQFWGQSLREKSDQLFKAGRRIPASDMYTTSLMITMDEKGEIVKVQVKSSSGVRELDDAAIESFNKAGPFPNPPSGMLSDGKATIEWGFVVKS